MSQLPVQTITHQSGQMGMFFGDQNELDLFTEAFNNSKVTDFILAPAHDYLITKELGAPRTPAQRFKANIVALKVLKSIRARNACATTSEQSKLSKFCGFGAISDIFDDSKAKTAKKREQLKSMITLDEYVSARKSTLSAFYTPYYLSQCIYRMLEAAGFGGGKVLDPAAGTGHLVSAMPEPIFENSTITAIELDRLTGEILENLLPNCAVYAGKGFESFPISNKQDLIIQNPPFGNVRIHDEDNQLNGLTLHNYFLLKSAMLLRDGGLMVAIVSTSFLDSKSSKTRERLSKIVSLKGAIRLPVEVFLEYAGANASVDVLLFQRRDSDSENVEDWVTSSLTEFDSDSFYLNDYFKNNPAAMVGEMQSKPSRNGKQVQCVSNSSDLVGDVQAAFKANFASNIYDASCSVMNDQENISSNDIVNVLNAEHAGINGFALTANGEIAKRVPNEESEKPKFVLCPEITGKKLERVSLMIPLKIALKELLTYEREDAAESEIEKARIALNAAYKAFKIRNGFINQSANRRVLSVDPYFSNLAALEIDFDQGISAEQSKRLGVPAKRPSAKPAAIFDRRVLQPWKAPTHAENAVDALWICWNDTKQIDLKRIATLTDQPVAEVKRLLVGTEIFLNPENLDYEFSSQYLSGNVKEKLKTAGAAAMVNKEFMVNYDALKQIIPEDIAAVDIKVEMTAAWLPVHIVKEFIDDLLSCNSIVKHALGVWHIKTGLIPQIIDHQQFGLPDFPASKVINKMMAGKPLVFRRKTATGSIVCQTETVQLESIANEIKIRFDEWIFKDDKRRKELVRLYNDTFNCFVRPVTNGEHLKLPELNNSIQLRPHQKNCVLRALLQSTLLIDMAVGAGKTYTMAAICHEWHRLGLKQRTAVVLPNHLVDDIASEWLNLYPTDELLVLSTESLSAAKRRETLNQIKTNSKIVLIPETTFKAIPLPLEIEASLIGEELEMTIDAINELEEHFSIKRMQAKADNLKFKLKELTNRKAKDETLDFADLGFDSLIVDEAHDYKNLMFSTSYLANVRGIGNPTGSQRAFDLYAKTRYLAKTFDHAGIVFSTGTPISNSIVELWTFNRYLAYENLKVMGLHNLDNWSGMFTSCSSEFEIDATGVNFKPVTRLRAFCNIAELQAQYGCFAETVTKEQLDNYLPKLPGGYNLIPPVHGGQPETVFVDPSQEQRDFIKTLVDRSKDFKRSPIANDNMLLLLYHARCASLDLRMLMPNALANPNSKAKACVEKVSELYWKHNEQKGTQLIFCDLSVPSKNKEKARAKIRELMKKANAGDDRAESELEKIGIDEVMSIDNDFDVYNDIKQQLIEKGIPESEIGFAQDYVTSKKKTELYAQLNSGTKRVVIASTRLLGTGANVNKKIVAVHHLDPTFKPADLEQRTGRGVRQGNEIYEANPAGFSLHVIYYATRYSLDSFLYQSLETKANWIQSFRSFKNVGRTIESLSSDSLTFAEIKAETSGNPLVLEHLQLTKEISKLKIQHKRHKKQQHEYSDLLAIADAKATYFQNAINAAQLDIKTVEANQLDKGKFFAIVGDMPCRKFSVAAESLMHLLIQQSTGINTLVMEYLGFKVFAKTTAAGWKLTIEGNGKYTIDLSHWNTGSAGTAMRAIKKHLTNLDSHIYKLKYQLTEFQAATKTAKAELGQEFSGLKRLIEAQNRLADVKRELMSQEALNQQPEQEQKEAA